MTEEEIRATAQYDIHVFSAADRMAETMVQAATNIARFPVNHEPVQPILFDLMVCVIGNLCIGLSGGNPGVAIDIIENVGEEAVSMLKEADRLARAARVEP